LLSFLPLMGAQVLLSRRRAVAIRRIFLANQPTGLAYRDVC
jgi:hypothetical protein